MPAIFEQDNQETEEVTAYNDVEIAGITEYLFNGKRRPIQKNQSSWTPVPPFPLYHKSKYKYLPRGRCNWSKLNKTQHSVGSPLFSLE